MKVLELQAEGEKKALELRGKRAEFDGVGFEWLTAPSGALAFCGRGGVVCTLNAGKGPIPLPAGELILTSAPLIDGQLPPDSAAWLV